MSLEPGLEALALALHDVGAVKFGAFKLKSGIISPVYVDLRVLVSHPVLLGTVADRLLACLGDAPYDLLCGVPYTALPFATLMSARSGKGMVMRRKEAKDYGTKKIIEGAFQPGQRCVVVEDLVTSGISVFETVAPLEAEGLVVSDIVVLLDRQQGGRASIEKHGKRLHAALTITQLLHVLRYNGRIAEEVVRDTEAFITANQVAAAMPTAPAPPVQHKACGPANNACDTWLIFTAARLICVPGSGGKEPRGAPAFRPDGPEALQPVPVS